MALVYDLTAAQSATSRFHGGGEYAKAVLKAIIGRPDRPEFRVVYRPDHHLDPHIDRLLTEARVERDAISGTGDLQRVLDDPATTAFYSALPYGYGGLSFRSVQLAYTIHGLRPLECPTDSEEVLYARTPRDRVAAFLKGRLLGRYVARQRASFEALLRSEARSVDVFVPSEHTRFALLAAFPWVPAERVHLAYSPAKPLLEAALDPEAVRRLLAHLGVEHGRYLLMTGGERWIKNGLRGARALDGLYATDAEGVPPTLVLGVADPERFTRHLRRPDQFRFADYVEAAELEALYGAAWAFLYPTLNEGFGYPPLEAMRHGTPVVSAAVASTTELYGDAVLYVDPRSEAEIQARVLRLVRDMSFREALGAAGRAREVVVSGRQETMLSEMVNQLLALGRS
ncbi:MAG: glycosyltransferase [Bacteroidota bacterium]